MADLTREDIERLAGRFQPAKRTTTRLARLLLSTDVAARVPAGDPVAIEFVRLCRYVVETMVGHEPAIRGQFLEWAAIPLPNDEAKTDGS